MVFSQGSSVHGWELLTMSQAQSPIVYAVTLGTKEQFPGN